MLFEGSLRRSAALLALAGGVEYGLQLAVPIILVRSLDESTFGQYRLLLLMLGTIAPIATAFMPQSLFYFLPRAGYGQKRLFIGNVLVYLIGAGCVTGILANGWNPWLHGPAKDLFFETRGISALFLAVAIVGSALDVLPTADGKAGWQANAVIGLALFRTLALVIAALTAADILWLAFAMLLVAGAKILLTAYYIHAHAEGGRVTWQATALKNQLAYALPFAIGNALFLLRMQADQWVVVSMLTPALYATFSIASVVLPIAALVRQPVNNALMPRLNHAYALGNVAEVGRLIVMSNGATALLLVPVIGALLVTASELVEIVYTSRYQQAAPIMQVYLIGMMMNAVAVGHVLSALGKGRFAAINSACCLVISVLLSILGIRYWGLTGGAIGSVLTLVLSELWALRVVARTLSIKMHRMVAWNELWPALFATCVASGGVVALTAHMGWHAFPTLVAKGLIYFVLFTTCFILAGGWKQLRLLVR